tara:strand:- start:3959 stop:4450 length:492 start_codon:yes stop_codon:yes gene_type:complete
MTAALITVTLLGIGGLGYSAVIGFMAKIPSDVGQHASIAIFFTLITLLAYSMTMFYLIGKGKAIREAIEEGGLSTDLYKTMATARAPVFGVGSMAMGLTMLTAILGGGVDTEVLPIGVHSIASVAMMGTNIFAFRVQVIALMVATEVVNEVDRQLVSSDDAAH